MRVAAILGLSSTTHHLNPFVRISDAVWHIGLPGKSDEADAILVVGGDGTVHRHLPQLVQLQLPVLVVPHGSGNDFARALGLRRVKDAVAAWRQFSSVRNSGVRDSGVRDSAKENVRRIDLGVISTLSASNAPLLAGASEMHGRYFCCVGGVGLDSEVARRANQLPRALRRRGGYLLSLLPALAGFHPVSVKIQTRENILAPYETRNNGPAMLVAFANTPTYGGGIRIAPHARLDDGRLEVCVVESMARARLLRLLPSAYFGRHLGLPEVRYFQAERLRIETAESCEVYADGEYVCQTPVEVTVEPAALKVIVPPARTG